MLQPPPPPPPPPARAAAAVGATASGAATAALEKYSAWVTATQKLTLPGRKGVLDVHIGVLNKGRAPAAPAGMTASRPVPLAPVSTAKVTARVTPFAPDFEVDPKQSQCDRIDPGGTDVAFTLTPKKSGNFQVGASVELFYSTDCSGPPVPKSAQMTTVAVSVNKTGIVEEGLTAIGKVTWDHFLAFWGTLVGIIFALILFLIRKKLAKWFGFKGKE